ncbi:unnamed protein product [Cuscuta epithymum]|uniref:Uncharacterized protein n=1 Tax=Cuscuta epithymum TaxID=186058 RepID=A0AAV0GKI3_9ASTE|nr:unnamed protein product [Cuscuta epithymum]
MDGFVLNLVGAPSGSIMNDTPPDPFFMRVESCLPNYPYKKLYEFASFLYVPKQTTKQSCEAFLHHSSDAKGRLQAFLGRDDACMVTGNGPILCQLQMTFQLKKRTILVFFMHSRGRVRLIAMSRCGLETPPLKCYSYEITTASCAHPRAQP